MDSNTQDSATQLKQWTLWSGAWLKKLAATFNAPLTPETVSAHLEALAVCSMEQLQPAFERTLREWDRPSQMPLPAFILARVQNTTLLAEQDWDLVDRIFRKHWYPDIGLLNSAPKLSVAAEYALRQIGGFATLSAIEPEKLTFVRRDFLQAHARFSSEGGAQVQLSSADASRVLDSLRLGELPEGWKIGDEKKGLPA